MIQLKDVCVKYRGSTSHALYRASCCVGSNGISAVVGKSGVGKSTLLKVMAGVYLPSDPIVVELTGRISVDDTDPAQLRGPGTISWVPQEPALLDHLTIAQNIALPLTLDRRNYPAHERSLALLQKLGIADRAHSRPRELSGGMRTRVSLARALISNPAYLFLDEPFVSLDVGNRLMLYRLIREERVTEGRATFIATHDVPEAVLLANRLLVIAETSSGTSIEEISNTPVSLVGIDTKALGEARQRAKEVEQKIYGEL